ncbi:hypothetical protein K9L67_01710 [Candidatus Woesearchaeota archaeon]|nr:hypothetical protein [Candidatus Woesearchaeota archaeon]MCF7900920.1 hypothetical protein [Candidatus Woesearchaeota archaeon]MCF8013032.1 hypothetical protein [Candidatus Woesearchaeota archaeon]
MVDDRLLKYVKDQKNKGVHPGNLKYRLREAGWSDKEVDELVNSVYSARKMVYVAFAFIILLVAFLAILIVLLLKNPTTVVIKDNSSSYNESTIISCKNILGMDLDKDACYRVEVENGFDCRLLNNPFERTFCFRALEVFVLNSQ